MTDGLDHPSLNQDKVQAALQFLRDNPDDATVRRIRLNLPNDDRFAYWLYLVDRRVGRMCGLSVHDLADFCSRDLFDAGSSPHEAALEALENDDIGSAVLAELE